VPRLDVDPLRDLAAGMVDDHVPDDAPHFAQRVGNAAAGW
jgi:hypothetical protein